MFYLDTGYHQLPEYLECFTLVFLFTTVVCSDSQVLLAFTVHVRNN